MKIKCKKIEICCFVLLSVLVLSSCEKKEKKHTEASTTTQINQVSVSETEGDGVDNYVNPLGYALFKYMEGEDSFCISPVSLELALSLQANGAKNETLKEMKKILNFSELNALNNDNQNFIYDLQKDGAEISISNAIWYDRGLEVTENFKTEVVTGLMKNYGANCNEADFTDSKTIKAINTWVSDATEEKIKKIINELSNDDKMIALNAIYFNGKWENEFNEEDTYEDIFQGLKGEENTDFMHMNDSYFQYAEYKDLRILRMPYKDSDYAMDIIISSENSGEKNATDIFGSFDTKEYEEMDEHIRKAESEKISYIAIPKFEFESDVMELNQFLFENGLCKAFTEDADFGKIAENIYISKVIQKTYIKVDECGTEAAAVTAVFTDNCTALKEDPLVFVADKPFVYVIRNKKDGTILFIGCIMDL